MKIWKMIGFAVVMMCLVISVPAAAWHASITKTGPEVACPSCNSYPYTITVNSLDWDEYLIEVNDTLPAGLAFVSATPAPTHVYANTPSAGKTRLIWDLYNVHAHTTTTITLNVKPTGLTAVSNQVTDRVKACYHFNVDGICTSQGSSWEGALSSNTVRTSFSDNVCPHDAPEFPSAAVPAAMIIGLIGLILVVRRLP